MKNRKNRKKRKKRKNRQNTKKLKNMIIIITIKLYLIMMKSLLLKIMNYFVSLK